MKHQQSENQQKIEQNQQKIEHLILDQKIREKVSFSSMSAGKFEKIREHSGLDVVAYEWNNATSSSSSSSAAALSSNNKIPGFQWSDENESQQSDRYLQYLRDNLTPWPRNLILDKVPKNMLDCFASRWLPFDLSGNADVMVVTRAANQVRIPQAGLVLAMELKKQVSDQA